MSSHPFYKELQVLIKVQKEVRQLCLMLSYNRLADAFSSLMNEFNLKNQNKLIRFPFELLKKIPNYLPLSPGCMLFC